MNCKHCNKECKSPNSLRNHERLCKENPGRDIANTLAARIKANRKVNCQFCNKELAFSNLKKHTKTCLSNPVVKEERAKVCPVCETVFYTALATCSYACSNKHFRSGLMNGNWKGKDYRNIAKINHTMECIICGENRIVAVHHYDENHMNNAPANLVPLCPTHHQYVHSRYKDLVMEQIHKYVVEQNKRSFA